MIEKLNHIAELSNRYGQNPEFVFLGGGNTSVKDKDFLYIKPSGVALATIKAEQFLKVDRKQMNTLFQVRLPDNTQIREAFAKSVLESAVRPLGAGRPSVETPLHNIIDYTYIVHLHPALINGMTCAVNGPEVCRRLFPEALWIDYCDAGCKLAIVAKEALDKDTQQRGHQPQVIFLQNHGVFVGANSPEEINQIYDRLFATLKAEYDKADICVAPPDLGTPESNDVADLAPVFRQLLADEQGNRPIVYAAGCTLPYDGPLTPDHIVYAKSFAFVGEPTTQAIQDFKQQRGYLPKVIGVPGKALFTVGASIKEARNVAIAVANALQVQKLAEAFGGPKFMTPREYQFIENWEVESYRRSVANAGKTPQRLDHKVAVVTGAAQGFGFGIAQELVRNGAVVAIADMNLEGAVNAAQAICQQFGPDKAFPVSVNVTCEDSVTAMLNEVTRICGGLDILVANAGVVRPGSVKTMNAKDWDMVTKVNYDGYFLCVKHAARIMARQIVDGKGAWMDIVQINSKSGLVGSNKNAAYAGSKFGAVGLTQSFALELVADRIKVNSVCPGNYFDGPLWNDPDHGLFKQYLDAGKVEGAKTIQDVRKHYEAKVPMNRGCTPQDVAKAIVYCVEQDYETGQAIPVTGGQVMIH